MVVSPDWLQPFITSSWRLATIMSDLRVMEAAPPDPRSTTAQSLWPFKPYKTLLCTQFISTISLNLMLLNYLQLETLIRIFFYFLV